MSEDKVDFEFRDTSPSDYEMDVKYYVKGDRFDFFFSKVAVAYKKKMLDIGKKIPDFIQEFEVVPEYINYLNTATKRQMRIINKEVLNKGAKIISSSIKKARFAKNEDGWEIKIAYEGQYVKR